MENENEGNYTLSSSQRYLTIGDLGGYYISFIKIDSKNNLVHVFTQDLPDLLEDYELSSARSDAIPFSKIEEVEIISNGNTIVKSNRGSQAAGAALGAALLGPAGLIVGGLSGSTTAREKIEQVKVRIRIQDVVKPLYELVVFNSEQKGGVKPDSFLVKSALAPVEELMARLKNIITDETRASKATKQISNKPHSIANELSELHKLLQSGVINELEFSDLKTKLIGKNSI